MSDAVDTDISDLDISDEELAELALAADPDAPVDDDAVPFNSRNEKRSRVAAVVVHARRRTAGAFGWRGSVALGISVGLVLCNTFAICVTNGIPSIP